MPSSCDTLLRLAPLLRAQFGLVTGEQARAVEVSRQQLDRLVRAGVLVRRWRGIYASACHADGWSHRALAAAMRCGPAAAVSHGAAARLLGLEQTGAGRRPRVELTLPRGARRDRVRDLAVHESLHLDLDRDCVEVGPFRVTNGAWTAATLAGRTDLGRAERIVDAAVANGHATADQLRELVDRWWHTPGVATLRAVLLRQLPEVALTRSEAERRFLRIVQGASLPVPAANVRVDDAAGRTRYLDFAYVAWRIAIEIDLHPSHGTTLGRNADGRRQNDLVPAWLPLRFDATDLRHRQREVVGQLRRALVAVGALP